MEKFTRIFVYFLAFAALIACSSDDDKPSGEGNEIINGGTIHTYEVVTIEGEGYTESTYEGTFNGNAVQLDNDTEGGLVFMVQPGMATIGGDNLLEVPSLDLKVTYRVEETVLEAPAEETLAPLIENLNSTDTGEFEQGQKVLDFIDSFNLYYASLPEAEKEEMAKYYMANSGLFDGIFLEELRPYGTTSSLSQCQGAKRKMAVLGVLAVAFANPGTMPLSILSAAGSVVAFKNAINHCTLFMSEEIKQAFLMFGDVVSSRPEAEGKAHRGGGNIVEFNSGEMQSFSAMSGMRGIQASDASDSNPAISGFFSYVSDINDFIVSTLNVVIAAYNDFAPSYFALEPFGQGITVPQSSEPAVLEMTQEIFGNLSFAPGNSSVELSNVSFNNGTVTMTLTITDPEQEEVATTLNYTYQDEYNNRQGSFNVVVLKDCSGLAVTATAGGDSATATAEGGQPPYTYSWSNGSTGATVSGLAEGDYTVTVTDAGGCTALAIVVVGPEIYETVTINSKQWSLRNLNVSHYRNGDPIPQVQDPAEWATLTTGAWCYPDGNAANGAIYGKLYNWYAVNDSRGLAPDGWHIPTNDEWYEMGYLNGNSEDAGGDLKEAGTVHWESPNTGATNSSGFTALPAGIMNPGGTGPQTFGTAAGFWTSTGVGSGDAYYWKMYHDNTVLHNPNFTKRLGLSVRIIKD